MRARSSSSNTRSGESDTIAAVSVSGGSIGKPPAYEVPSGSLIDPKNTMRSFDNPNASANIDVRPIPTPTPSHSGAPPAARTGPAFLTPAGSLIDHKNTLVAFEDPNASRNIAVQPLPTEREISQISANTASSRRSQVLPGAHPVLDAKNAMSSAGSVLLQPIPVSQSENNNDGSQLSFDIPPDIEDEPVAVASVYLPEGVAVEVEQPLSRAPRPQSSTRSIDDSDAAFTRTADSSKKLAASSRATTDPMSALTNATTETPGAATLTNAVPFSPEVLRQKRIGCNLVWLACVLLLAAAGVGAAGYCLTSGKCKAAVNAPCSNANMQNNSTQKTNLRFCVS